MTLVSIVLMVGCVTQYFNCTFGTGSHKTMALMEESKKAGSIVKLQATPTPDAATKTDFSSPDFYSKDNFNFYDHTSSDVLAEEPTAPYNLKNTGVKSLKLVLTDQAEKQSYDEESVFKKILGLSSKSPYVIGEEASREADINEMFKYIA